MQEMNRFSWLGDLEFRFKSFFEGQYRSPDGEPFTDVIGFVASQVYNLPLETVSFKDAVAPSNIEARRKAKLGLFTWLSGTPMPEFDYAFPALAHNKDEAIRRFSEPATT